MTHAELVQRAAHWLRNTQRCGVVTTNCWNSGIEIPDAMGWKSWYSYLIECKTSRSDFRRDLKKLSRKYDDAGPGNFRYYMCEPRIIPIEELPAHWGLLEVRPHQIRIRRHADSIAHVRVAAKERPILVSLLRKYQAQENQ